MRDRTSARRGQRGGKRRSKSRARSRRFSSSPRFAFPNISLSAIRSFAILATFWVKHGILDLLLRRNKASEGGRERIYVDASYTAGALPGDPGIGGIGVWIPRRGIALALKVDAHSSMDAEILALLAGALAAKRLKVERPIIFSDCKSAVRMGSLHMNVGRTRGPFRQLRRLAEYSTEHGAFRHLYNSMRSLRGTLEWQPRENNREADLASSIGSRLGNMGISLSGAKNRNHALNDVLSLAPVAVQDERGGDMIHRRYRCGTRTVSLASDRVATSRTFLREARGLIERLSAEVA